MVIKINHYFSKILKTVTVVSANSRSNIVEVIVLVVHFLKFSYCVSVYGNVFFSFSFSFCNDNNSRTQQTNKQFYATHTSACR